MITTCLSSALALLTLAPQSQERVDLPFPVATTQERTPIDAIPETTVVTLYDVKDLIEHDSPAEAPEDEAEARRFAVEREQRLLEETRALATFLDRHIDPPLAAPGETIRAAAVGNLVVVARPTQHAWIKRLFDLQRDSESMVHLGVRYLEGPRGCFDEYGKDGTVSFLDEKTQLPEFLKLMQDAGTGLLNAPQVVAYNLQKCSIQLMNEIAYVKEYRLIVVEPGSQEIADPIVDTVKEGYFFEMRAALLEEDVYALDIELTRAEIQRPIPTRKVRLSPTIPNEVEVSTPVCLSSTVEAKLVVEEGMAVLFLTPSNKEDRDMACVLTVKSITPAGLGSPSSGTEKREW